MEDMNRRSAIALGLTAATLPILGLPTPAAAAAYGPDEGQEVHPGIRVIELGKRESMIAAYKEIALIDLVFQPAAVYPDEAMMHDMVCQVTDGELQIKQGSMEFAVKPGDIYSCGKGAH